MILDKVLKDLMHKRELSVTHLANSIDIPVSTLHGWPNGVEPKSISQLKVVADFFDISLDRLCFGHSKPISSVLDEHEEEIKAGVYEVVLRRVR